MSPPPIRVKQCFAARQVFRNATTPQWSSLIRMGNTSTVSGNVVLRTWRKKESVHHMY
jgi:hypothetical protein